MTLQKDEIDHLLKGIRKSAHSLANGGLELEEARAAYQEHYQRYRAIRQDVFSQKSDRYIKGILFQHNSSNFSILSGILIHSAGGITPMIYAGDKIFMMAVPELLSEGFQTFEGDECLKIQPGIEPYKKYTLYAYRFMSGAVTYYFIAVSSSQFFNEPSFRQIYRLTTGLYHLSTEYFDPLTIEYLHDVYKNIRARLAQSSDNYIADLYLFPSTSNALTRLDIYSLTEFTGCIVNTLKESYPEDAEIYAISPGYYCALYPEAMITAVKSPDKGIEFYYRENKLPYRFKKEVIPPGSPVEKFFYGLE